MTTHGKPGTYTNGGCRCKRCRSAWAAYFRTNGYGKRYKERLATRKERAEQGETT